MRITVGKHKNRYIEAPEGYDVRPTSSMVREAIFNVLNNLEPAKGKDSLIQQQNIADICCGSGVIGFEALSRGANRVVFVDSSRTSIECTRSNAEKIGEEENCDFMRLDATMLPEARQPVSTVFLDPPYRKNLSAKIIKSLIDNNWLIDEGVIIVELSTAEHIPDIAGVELIKQKTYGKTKLLFYRKL